MENINAILERFTRAEIAATAAQTQTYPNIRGTPTRFLQTSRLANSA